MAPLHALPLPRLLHIKVNVYFAFFIILLPFSFSSHLNFPETVISRMVAIACHSLALLTIAACAVTALGADEVEGGNQNVAAQVSETNEGQAVIPGRKGVNPVLAGAAVGSTLFLALLLFGLKVLGKKVVQTDSKVGSASAS